MSIEALRTPEERFALLPGYPCVPNYLDEPIARAAREHFGL